MPNTLLTPTMITREALRVLHNNIVFVKGVNRQYSSEFGISGAKIGSTINVRKPNKYYVRSGPVLQAQATSETFVPLTLSNQVGVDVNFSSAELTLSLDDFSKRILTPAMAKLSSNIDSQGLSQVVNVWNQVGSPGTTPGSANAGANFTTSLCPQIYLNAGVMLDNNATPRDENRRVVLNPLAMAGSVANLSGLFQDAGSIGEQYRKGVLGTALGFEFALDQNVQTITLGTHAGNAAANCAGANQTGANLTTAGWTANSAVLNVGEVFTIANVYAANPESGQNTGVLQYFVVTANVSADANGNATIPIAPSMVLAANGIANFTVANLCVNGAALTVSVSGNANSTYPLSVAYHQDAFTLGTADLEMPSGVDFAARETYDGISMRIVRAYDINNDQFPCRIDVLLGWATLRPELACRITG